MPILLFSDAAACAATLPALAGPAGPAVILSAGAPSADFAPLRAALPEIAAVDLTGDRLGRLNFDALTLAVIDLDPDFLASSPGRRLVDALGRLARESLALAFAGPAVALTGGLLLDGLHAGLGLVPGTAVIPDVRAVEDLRALLARLAAQGVRLLALDAPVGLRYEAAAPGAPESVRVRGAGSVLLASFVPPAAPAAPADPVEPADPAHAASTARLHVLTDGLASGWPA